MRYVICHTCKSIIQLGGDSKEISYLLGDESSFSCVTPLCRGRMQLAPSMKGFVTLKEYRLKDMPIRSFYRATNGFGPGPDSTNPASLKRLKDLLLSRKVVSLNGEEIGLPTRVILRELVLEDGTRIHFETSAKGACVYYIEEAVPSCLEIVDNELNTSPATSGVHSNREEDGRASETNTERLPDVKGRAS